MDSVEKAQEVAIKITAIKYIFLEVGTWFLWIKSIFDFKLYTKILKLFSLLPIYIRINTDHFKIVWQFFIPHPSLCCKRYIKGEINHHNKHVLELPRAFNPSPFTKWVILDINYNTIWPIIIFFSFT